MKRDLLQVCLSPWGPGYSKLSAKVLNMFITLKPRITHCWGNIYPSHVSSITLYPTITFVMSFCHRLWILIIKWQNDPVLALTISKCGFVIDLPVIWLSLVCELRLVAKIFSSWFLGMSPCILSTGMLYWWQRDFDEMDDLLFFSSKFCLQEMIEHRFWTDYHTMLVPSFFSHLCTKRQGWASQYSFLSVSVTSFGKLVGFNSYQMELSGR